MKFWVGVTDNNWYKFLAQRKFEEVNFWQPSAKALFKNAQPGMPFLFKLKRPFNHLAGGGFFVTYTTLPLSLAWEVFGEKNGAQSLDELRALMQPLMTGSVTDPEVGCTVLTNPVFLDQFDWMENPPGWAGSIVRGKMYESNQADGEQIWKRFESFFVQNTSSHVASEPTVASDPPKEGPKFGEPILVKPRLGQSSFRVLVTDAYKRRCAMTGESTLIVLEAAHIVPYARDGTHEISNGLLLRSDFHKLFDKGLVSVTPEYRMRISPRIREAWFNGKAYYRLDNQPLAETPDTLQAQPDRDRLEWHFKNVFQG